ncbi:MAG: low molecular weight phosphotyrosine protein phosphatase [Chloroflexota bacterium]|nr:low molecular weight phosphotyrosine protein phosphatase [Chloroflexota bacterium]
MKRILLVCTANICRSPIAAGLLRARLATAGLAEGVEVRSAGVQALVGERASPVGVALLATRGIDISRHVASSVTEDDLQQADLVLVMSERHRQSLFHYSPADLYKVLLLSELVYKQFDIADPYGQSKATYAATIALIDRIFERGWANLLERVEGKSNG